MGILQRIIFGALVLLFTNGARPMDGQTVSFIRPTPAMDQVTAVAANALGIYVVGSAVRKYDSAGNELWTRAVSGPPFAVATDATGAYVIGPGQGSGGPQLLLRKYNDGGSELWTRPVQPPGFAAIATDTSGVYAAARAGFQHSLTKYGGDGSQSWT